MLQYGQMLLSAPHATSIVGTSQMSCVCPAAAGAAVGAAGELAVAGIADDDELAEARFAAAGRLSTPAEAAGFLDVSLAAAGFFSTGVWLELLAPDGTVWLPASSFGPLHVFR